MSQSGDSSAATNEKSPASDVVSDGAVFAEATNQNGGVSDDDHQNNQSETNGDQNPATNQSAGASDANNPNDQPEPNDQNAPNVAAARDAAIPSLMSLNVQKPPARRGTSKSAHRFREIRSFRSFWNASRRVRDKNKKKKPRSLKDVELPEYVRWWAPGGCFQCVVCEIKGYYMSSLNGVKDHCESRRHRTEAAKFKEELQTEGVPVLKVTSSAQFDRGFQAHILTIPMTQQKARMVFTVTNMTPETSFKFVRWHGPYLNGELRLLKPPPPSPGEEDIFLEPDESLDLTMEITPKEETTLSFKVYFRFEEDLGGEEERCASLVENCPVRITVVKGEEKNEPDTEREERLRP